MSMRLLMIFLAATGCAAAQPPVAALTTVAPEPEFVAYERNMDMPDVPVVYSGEEDIFGRIRENEYEVFGIMPLSQYTHVIRYSVAWQLGMFETENTPRLHKYIIQVALAGDESRAQVLLLEYETPAPAGRSPVRRSMGWITPAAFSELRRKVLRDATALPGVESGFGSSMIRRSHSNYTRLELHSGGPAQIDLTRFGHSNRPASAYAAGEHLIAAAEQALGRTIRRP
jgi:hypothetical protein